MATSVANEKSTGLFCNEGNYELSKRVSELVILGCGKYGSYYHGTLRGVHVAVLKVVQNSGGGQAGIMQMNHPNIVKLLEVQDDPPFRMIAFEVCAAALTCYLNGFYQGPFPDLNVALSQMAAGLQHIHECGFSHNALNTENILISLPNSESQTCLKIVACDGSLRSSDTSENRNLSQAIDIYALGSVFLGLFKHTVNYVQSPRDKLIEKIINWMIKWNAVSRPTITRVLEELRTLQHPSGIKIGSRCLSHWSDRVWIYSCKFHPRKSKLVCVTDRGRACLYSSTNPSLPFEEWSCSTLRVNVDHPVTVVNWKRDGTLFALGCGDGTVSVLTEEGEECYTVKLHSSRVNCLAWNWNLYDSNFFVTGGQDMVAIVWDSRIGPRHKFSFHGASILHVLWLSCDSFVSASEDGVIHICQFGCSVPLRTLNQQVSICCLRWNPDDQSLVTCCLDGSLKFHSLNDNQPAITFQSAEDKVSCFDWFSNLLLASGGWKSSVTVEHISSGRQEPTILRGFSGKMCCVAFSPNGMFLAAVDNARILQIWSTVDWRLEFRSTVPAVFANCLEWNATSRRLAIANQSKNVWMVELNF